MVVEPSKKVLITITDMLESNQIKISIDSVFSLDYVKQAIIKSESARATSKIVIEVVAN